MVEHIVHLEMDIEVDRDPLINNDYDVLQNAEQQFDSMVKKHGFSALNPTIRYPNKAHSTFAGKYDWDKKEPLQ